jgi:hypothetical protein
MWRAELSARHAPGGAASAWAVNDGDPTLIKALMGEERPTNPKWIPVLVLANIAPVPGKESIDRYFRIDSTMNEQIAAHRYGWAKRKAG